MINDDTLVIVDFKDELKAISSYKQGYDLYQLITLKELIENILTVPSLDYDFSTYIWDYLSQKLDLDNTNIEYDYDVVDLFIDTITQILDEKLRLVFPKEIDYGKYVIDRWLGNTSIVMRKYEYFRITDFCEG